jgi:hypothetical protein
MLTSEPSEHTDTSVSSAGNDGHRRSSLGRWVGYGLLLAFGVIVVAAVVFSIKVSEGVSRDLTTPRVLVRLQIVNGSGVKGAGVRMASQLTGYIDRDLEIAVVDTSDFEAVKVAKTFVISRTEDGKGARLLAAKLGLDPSAVVTRRLDYDTHMISATLVMGQDYGAVSLKKNS